jgi:type III secretory pathway lipoprotein EscJ
MNLEELYQQHIEPLPVVDKLRLIALIAQGLADQLREADQVVTARATMVITKNDARQWNTC